MDEKKTDEKADVTETDKDTGDKPKDINPIESANATIERLEKANEETARLGREQDEREAKRIIGGSLQAGQSDKPKDEDTDEAAIEYAKKALANDIPRKE